MNKKLILFPLSLLAVIATSCASTGGYGSYTHTHSNELKHYTADLDHDGAFSEYEKNLTWAEAYDTLIEEANSIYALNEIADKMKISKNESERTNLARYEVLHEAEELLMSTNAVAPLYNYSDPYMMKDNIKGIYCSPLGSKFFDQLTGKGDEQYNVCVGTKADTLDPHLNTDSSTSMFAANTFIGIKRWVKSEESEKYPGTYNSEVGRGIAKTTKKLLINGTPKDPDKEVDIRTTEIPEAEYDNYINTARYYIEIDEDAKWNNGEDVTNEDFIWSWHRAANKNAGSFCSMFDCIRGYNEWFKQDTTDFEEPNPDQPIFSGLIKDKTNDKKFIIQLINDCAYFDDLLAFPAYVPLHKKSVKANMESWWMDPKKLICNGPFQYKVIDNVESGKVILEPNPYYKGEITAKNVKFSLIDDDSSIFLQYKGNSLDMIDSIPSGMIDYAKIYMASQFKVTKQIGLYYLLFNVNDNTFDIKENEDESIRECLRGVIVRLINRNDITNSIVKSGATPANGFISTDIIEHCYPVWDEDKNAYVAARDQFNQLIPCDWHYRNGDLYQEALEKGGYKNVNEHYLEARNNNTTGFYSIPTESVSEELAMKSIVNDAIKLANKAGIEFDYKTGKFINFPELTASTNSGAGHENILERMQFYLRDFGITLKIQTQEWNAYTTNLRDGGFAFGRNGWIADYSDARTYLDIATSTSGSNYFQFGLDTWHKSR